MRLFLHTYAIDENFDITRREGVFGVKDDRTGLATKARRLRPNDVIIIRDARSKEHPRFFGSCIVVGKAVDQRRLSPYSKLLWVDEQAAGQLIYPIRVRVFR